MYIAAYYKTKEKNGGLDLNNSVETSCPLGHTYDADIHDAIAHLRILDGSLPAHPTDLHGRSVNFFADVGRPKYWIEASSPAFGFFLMSLFFLTLDMESDATGEAPNRTRNVPSRLQISFSYTIILWIPFQSRTRISTETLISGHSFESLQSFRNQSSRGSC